MDGLALQLQVVLGTRYRVEGVAATGGMSTVVRAVDLKHDRVVAVKVLHDDVADRVGTDRFLREIQMIARLQHPHIVPLFDSGAADGLLYYTMPFVDGETLRERMQRDGRLPVSEALAIARELCDALAYAHERDILHRDVKPENILLTNGHALLSDFGVARAIHAATLSRHTGSGMAVGTLAYMSPEQASGERELDGRSDVYSLGCVVYEMLAGHPPHTGPNAQVLLAERFRSAPKPLRTTRDDVPERVEQAVARALASDPDARIPSARAFGQELVITGEQPATSAARRWPRIAVAAVAIAAAGLVTRFFMGTGGEAAVIDPNALAVLPLRHSAASAESLFSGDHSARMLYDALGRWRGITLVDDMRVRDLRSRGTSSPRSLGDVLTTSQALGAGLVVWGEVIETSGGVEIRASLYRVDRSLHVLQSAQTRIDAADSPDSAFMQLADQLLTGGVAGAPPATSKIGTRDLRALRAYVNAQSALGNWKLAAAESLFRDASTIDPEYGRALLWLAQVQSWRNESPIESWGVSARQAEARAERLTPTERVQASALSALAAQDAPTACAKYRELIAADSLSFAGWFGMGECQSRDRLVVADRRSRSGWRFRSSQRNAIAAYRRAFELVPSFQRTLSGLAFDRLSQLLYAEVNYVRMGYVVAKDTLPFAAYPELADDTLAFVPFFRDSVFAGARGTDPPNRLAAVESNQRLLRDLARAWVTASARDPLAWEALSLALELNGALAPDPTSNEEGSAVSAMARARTLARDPETRLRLAARHVRLLLKLDRDVEAVALADSLIDAPPTVTSQSLLLAGLAALVGRTAAAANWARMGAAALVVDDATGEQRFPIAPAREALALLVFAANGLEGDSVRVLTRRVESLIESSTPRAQQLMLRQSLLDWPATLAFPLVGPSPLLRHESAGNVHMRIAHALSRGDTAIARLGFARLDELAARERPGDAGFDAIALEVELLQLTGDTASARSLADRTLNALPSSGRQLVERLAESAALPRLILRRYEMAQRGGDRDGATRWATRFLRLTPHADGATRILHTQLQAQAVPH